MELPEFVNVDDYEPVARERLPTDVYDYYAGGAGEEWTLAENRRAFDRWILRPRFLKATGPPNPSTELFGTRVSAPILVAPWAYQKLAHPDGELATARAAAREGTIMVVSTTAVDYLEDVAKASDGPKWWQLYIFSDRGYTTEMLSRVAGAGYGAICWTIDFPTNGFRERDTRNGFVMPMGLSVDELVYDPLISWDDVAYIREHVPGVPLLVKGVLTAEDAELAVQAGLDGIVVSNHGGRQLDFSAAGITALPEVVDAVAGRIPVLMDGGVRRGTAVLKALALGASAVLVGRPAAWGLAVAGEDGVADVLRILREEFENAMALVGCRTVDEIGPSLVAPAP
ncbi:MAG TPA: alpha-hydroxy acid oxidase [Actinomycetota bacterium]|nr:alpha-hydroxy acid oxidase [Actinomycetota bacterium]